MTDKREKPKIAIIGLKGLPAFGGAAAVGENIIHELYNDYNFTVYSISSHTSDKTGRNLKYHQIVFKSIRNKKFNTLLYYIKSLFHAIFKGNYDLIHLHHRDAAFIIPFLKIRYKVVLTTHGLSVKGNPKWEKYNWFFDMQVKHFIKYANYRTCVSQSEKRILKNEYNIESTYIPNGISLNPEYQSIQKKDYVYFAAGRIMHSKGCHLFLDAMDKVKSSIPIIISGQFTQDDEYIKMLSKYNSYKQVTFTGMIKEKSILFGYLKFARFFVFPSMNEAMSMMLLEAIALGCPVICSDIQANKDIFSDDEVLFFSNGNSDDLSRKIKFAINNCEAMAEYASKALITATKKYTWNSIAIKYKKVYNLLCKTDEKI
ncbi:MAG: glycosyltransferase family 1 protein [Bacteroidia bacterium]|nr:glycosyltransferase family 1 protein [Bacteroidia bacterium]